MRRSAPLTALLCILLQWRLALCNSFETASPHFLFMKELRSYLSTAEIVLPKIQEYRPNAEGRLIATSMEGENSTGKGYSTNGFVFENTNELMLDFTITAEKGHEKFPEVELWVFPDKTGVQSGNEKTIRYEAIANVAALNTPRKDPGEVKWDTSEDCIQINLTQLSNKIYNKFNKSSINESHVTLTIKVKTVATNLAIHSNNARRPAHHSFCSLLAKRATNNSFIFIKNYEEVGSQVARSRKRRSSPISDPEENSNSKQTCGRTSLEVNLTEIYGSFVKGPTMVDISDCYGDCSSSTKGNLFSHHSIVKERLKKILPHGNDMLDYNPSCVPTKFQPLRAHFSLKNKSHVIVQLPDLVVTECGCR